MSTVEKVTINMSVVDLGKIDLLVEEGFYSNRTDFMRTAIRNHLDKHEENVQKTVAKRNFVIGVLRYERSDLEKQKELGATLSVSVVGLFSLADDVTPELARETISSVTVVGVFRANSAVKKALSDRT
ncbi:CopG family transcriptional regulator [Haloglycomyces albus]|uniref:CopG family transcriptional regulator n=1 Tax=Haloglycomyces albus TaxID=526067 RepID=UPI00046D8786|nr:CopG family transcriptional regulator [Haloglycomyces albus]